MQRTPRKRGFLLALNLAKLIRGIMLYQINHSFLGRITSIGDLDVQYANLRLAAVGDIKITYSRWGKVSEIDGQSCYYENWWSPMSSVGNTEITWSWGRMQLIGSLPVVHGFWGSVLSIGDMQISYDTFGRMIEINTNGTMTHQQQVALVIVLLRIQESANNSGATVS
jgi:hypothetical protein